MRAEIKEPYKVLNKYAGMGPQDTAIWEQFVLNNPGQFLNVWYNVHVGNPTHIIHDEKETKASGWYDVSCWCIDVLAEDKDAYYVIEVKPNALAGALGQALAYTKLIDKSEYENKPFRPLVLTDDIAPITRQAAFLLGVGILTP